MDKFDFSKSADIQRSIRDTLKEINRLSEISAQKQKETRAMVQRVLRMKAESGNKMLSDLRHKRL